MNAHERSNSAAPKPRSAWPMAVGGFLLSLAAGVSFMFMLDHEWIRRSGVPNVLFMGAGLGMSIAALRLRPRWAGMVSTIAGAALLGLFMFGMYFSPLPKPQGIAPGTALASGLNFELPATGGGIAHLAELAARGPVLVVFYRGFW